MKKSIVSLLIIVLILSFAGVSAIANEEVETIEKDGFVCERLRDGNLKLVQYIDDNSGRTVNIPSSIDGSHIEQIGSYAFNKCKSENITIPDTVRVIETFAFNECTGIQKITIPNDVLFISGNPFTGCTSLVNISLAPNHPTMQVTTDGALYSKRNKMLLCYPCSKTNPSFSVLEGTLTIGNYAFSGCKMLESISLPTTVTGICEGAFLDCARLTNVVLPDSLLTIDEVAFAGCTSLRGISIPNRISRIETSTFFKCESMTSVSFPSDLVTISDRAFYGCRSLKEIRLPKNTTNIGDNAFDGCASLTDAYIPVAVTNIGDNAFENCSVQLYMHLDEYAYAEVYAKLYNISFTYGNENSFLTSENEDGQ